jgi:hypothetical protein
MTSPGRTSLDQREGACRIVGFTNLDRERFQNLPQKPNESDIVVRNEDHLIHDETSFMFV